MAVGRNVSVVEFGTDGAVNDGVAVALFSRDTVGPPAS